MVTAGGGVVAEGTGAATASGRLGTLEHAHATSSTATSNPRTNLLADLTDVTRRAQPTGRDQNRPTYHTRPELCSRASRPLLLVSRRP